MPKKQWIVAAALAVTVLSLSRTAAAAAASTPFETNGAVEATEKPIVLTPKPGPEPRINGARIFGVRPGSPFLFTIPATGERPMTFSADGLPEGLVLDAQTGRISGAIAAMGEVTVHKLFISKNKDLYQAYPWSQGYLVGVAGGEKGVKMAFTSVSGQKGQESLVESIQALLSQPAGADCMSRLARAGLMRVWQPVKGSQRYSTPL